MASVEKKNADKMHPYGDALEIGLLEEFNCIAALLSHKVLAQDNSPYAVCTKLRWGIVGVVSKQNHQQKHTFRTQVREMVIDQIKRMYELEFSECSGKSTLLTINALSVLYKNTFIREMMAILNYPYHLRLMTSFFQRTGKWH